MMAANPWGLKASTYKIDLEEMNLLFEGMESFSFPWSGESDLHWSYARKRTPLWSEAHDLLRFIESFGFNLYFCKEEDFGDSSKGDGSEVKLRHGANPLPVVPFVSKDYPNPSPPMFSHVSLVKNWIGYPRKFLKILPPQLRAPFSIVCSSRMHPREQIFFAEPLSVSSLPLRWIFALRISLTSKLYTGLFEFHLSKIFMELAYAGGLLVDVGPLRILQPALGRHRNPTRHFRSKPLGIIQSPVS